MVSLYFCTMSCIISVTINLLIVSSELSPTNYPIPVPSSTKIHSSSVNEGLKALQLNMAKSELNVFVHKMSCVCVCVVCVCVRACVRVCT